MSALEAIGPPYLFKLRQRAGVKKRVQRQWTGVTGAALAGAGMPAKTCRA